VADKILVSDVITLNSQFTWANGGNK